jgi:hypothetical protein
VGSAVKVAAGSAKGVDAGAVALQLLGKVLCSHSSPTLASDFATAPASSATAFASATLPSFSAVAVASAMPVSVLAEALADAAPGAGTS